jgi:predicted RND superfamily exporter protein
MLRAGAVDPRAMSTSDGMPRASTSAALKSAALGRWLGESVTRTRGASLLVLAIWLTIAAVGGVIGAGIKVNTDLKALLPPDAPSLDASRVFKERKGSTDRLTIAIESSDAAANVRVAERLGEVLGTWEDLDGVIASRDYTAIRDHALFYLELDDLTALRDRLVKERRRAIFRKAAADVADDPAGEDDAGLDYALAGEDWDADPSAPPSAPPTPPGPDPGVRASGKAGPSAAGAPGDRVGQGGAAGGQDISAWMKQHREQMVEDGRLRADEVDLIWPAEDEQGRIPWIERVAAPQRSPDGTIVLVSATPNRPPTDVRYAKELSSRVSQAVEALDLTALPADLRVQVVGGYDVTGDVNQILVDLGVATWLSAALVGVVLIAGFRNLRGLVLVIVPVTVAVLVTLGFAKLVFDELNSLTAFLFAVLFGMGVDFAVHLYTQREAHGREGRWGDVLSEHLAPLLSTMVTTVASLWVLALADFKAFREFGVISGFGVVMCLVVALMLVPALDALMGPRRWVRAPAATTPAKDAEGSRGRASRSGWIPALRGTFFAVAAVVVVLGVPRLGFEQDLRKLRPVQEKGGRIAYGKAVGENRDTVPVAMFAEDPAVLDEAVARLTAEKVEATPGAATPARWVKDVVSVATLLPQQQAEKAPLLAEIAEVTEGFLAELPDLPSDDEAHRYQTHLEALERLASARPMVAAELPSWATDPFTERDGRSDRIASLFLAYDRSNLVDVRATFARVEAALAGLEVRVATTSFIYVDLYESLEIDAQRLPLLALGVILAATFGALVAGLAVSLGLMGLLGLRINFYNLVVMPAVLGLGIDASIHLWHAARHGSFGTTGKGAALAALTTIGAFGGLLAARHPGLRSIADLGVLAIAAFVLVAFSVLTMRGITGAAIPPSDAGD